jgi:hypothetical protein
MGTTCLLRRPKEKYSKKQDAAPALLSSSFDENSIDDPPHGAIINYVSSLQDKM